jgi:hypothetical protein
MAAENLLRLYVCGEKVAAENERKTAWAVTFLLTRLTSDGRKR